MFLRKYVEIPSKIQEPNGTTKAFEDNLIEDNVALKKFDEKLATSLIGSEMTSVTQESNENIKAFEG